jgi:DNA-binding NarL/FixJ family response regulator
MHEHHLVRAVVRSEHPQAPASESGIRLLIADDSAYCRSGLRALLDCQSGFETVGEAASGQEAVRLVEARQPDVVLMDVQMPVLDGLQATRMIKARWPGVRVVVLSTCATRRIDAVAAGADTFLVKGCPTEALLAAIVAVHGAQHGAADRVAVAHTLLEIGA